MTALPGLPAPANNEPEVVRVGFIVAHVPTLRTEPCKCGSSKETTEAQAIEAARRGEELRIECACGRVVVVQRRLVIVPGRKS